ncbi:hypothetical protein MARA_61800 [Mycolicibacterium arabiense]|uniref:Uncharacterized protein n=2 Tax=Mycolicibacterium arabiense TaxID=1286181 RepID=A0A7I7S761_9MYCO|nr:hypothetical protein MARA_61800 [Mycolicibacterium arabiense]
MVTEEGEMSTVTAADLMTHPVMGDDWHEWPLLVGVLIACWMTAIVATAALLPGPERARAPRVTRAVDTISVAGDEPTMRSRRI